MNQGLSLRIKKKKKGNNKSKYKKIPISLVRVLLYFMAILSFGLVVLNWWWAYYHDGYVVISFKEFGEFGWEFFLIHGFFILLIVFTIIAIRSEIK